MITATYLIHDDKDLVKKRKGLRLIDCRVVHRFAAAWTRAVEKHKGVVQSIEQLEEDERVNTFFGKRLKRALVRISYPSVNFSADFPAILTTTFGKLSLDGTIKLVDLTFSDELKRAFPGRALALTAYAKSLAFLTVRLWWAFLKRSLGVIYNTSPNN